MSFRACIAVLVLLSGTRLAAAQETIVEGPGYEVGEGTVIHPSVGMTTGVLYNPFHENQAPESTPVIRLRGAVSIASQDHRPAGKIELLKGDADTDAARDAAPALEFRAGALLDLEFYASSNEAVSRRLLSGSLTGHIMTAPRGPVSFFADETILRASSPVNFEPAYGRNLNRIINRFAGGAQVRPGDGAFRFALQYENTVDIFEPDESIFGDPDASSFANRIQHLARGRAEWQFLPITRFFFDASWGWFGPLTAAPCELIKRQSRPLRVQLGAATALTELTSLRAHIGYGKGFYQSLECDIAAADFSNVLLGAELGYRYSPLGRLSVTYEYDFQDSIEANYYRDHALVGRLLNQVDRVMLQGGIDLRLRHYDGLVPGLVSDLGQTTRDDLLLRLSGKGYYLYREWLGFTGSLDLVNDSTDFVFQGRQLGYTRAELQLGVVAAF
jgi:hypothetical protein